MNNITNIFVALFPIYFDLLHKSMANEAHQTKYIGGSFQLSSFLTHSLLHSEAGIWISSVSNMSTEEVLPESLREKEKKITNSFSSVLKQSSSFHIPFTGNQLSEDLQEPILNKGPQTRTRLYLYRTDGIWTMSCSGLPWPVLTESGDTCM